MMNQTTDRTADALAKLEDGIKNLASSDAWQAYLRMQAAFHQYSYANVLLILAQRPDASRVAGLKTWNGLNRKVVKGERALWILAPIFPKKAEGNDDRQDDAEKTERRPVAFRAVPVFALEQTDGEALPRPVRNLDGDTAGNLFERLAAFSAGRGCPVTVQAIDSGANGTYSPAENRIAVREGLAPDQACKTLSHEIGHSLMHNDPDVYAAHRGDCELEAESVAFVVLSHFGVDAGAYSFGYTATWAGGDEAAIRTLKTNATRIQATARKIIDAIAETVTEEAEAP